MSQVKHTNLVMLYLVYIHSFLLFFLSKAKTNNNQKGAEDWKSEYQENIEKSKTEKM